MRWSKLFHKMRERSFASDYRPLSYLAMYGRCTSQESKRIWKGPAKWVFPRNRPKRRLESLRGSVARSLPKGPTEQRVDKGKSGHARRL